jgi:hypothetical protein
MVINRRDFVLSSAAAAFGQAPTMMTPRSVKPVVIASSNGNRFKNGGTMTCVEQAFGLITKGEHAGVSMYDATYAVCTEHGPQTVKTEALYEGKPTE